MSDEQKGAGGMAGVLLLFAIVAVGILTSFVADDVLLLKKKVSDLERRVSELESRDASLPTPPESL